MKGCWLALLLFGLAPLEAQVDIGVTGGVPLTPFILNTSAGDRSGFAQIASATRRYTIGPNLEFHIHGPVGIETGALYKRFGFDTVSASSVFSLGPTAERVVSSTTGNSWEFPILAKVHLRFLPGVNGFLTAGPSIRRLTGVTEAGERTLYPTCPPPCAIQIVDYKTDSPAAMDRRISIGAAFGAGFEFRIGSLRLDPGFRVTRWDSERTSSIAAASRFDRTQADVLLTVAHSVAGDRETPHDRIPGSVEFGVLAAVPYAAGALVDWRWLPRWSLEGSFLTRPFRTSTLYESVSGYSWEVPLLLKWRAAKIRSANFVVGAGPAILRASNTTKYFTASSAVGAAVTGGIEFRAGRVRLRPEIRYDWFSRPLYDFYVVRSRQDSLFLTFALSRASP